MNRSEKKTTAPKAHRPGPEESPPELTSRGRSVAEEQSVTDSATAEEERAFMRAIVAGLTDLEAGRELPLAEAKVRLLKSRHAERGRPTFRCSKAPMARVATIADPWLSQETNDFLDRVE